MSEFRWKLPMYSEDDGAVEKFQLNDDGMFDVEFEKGGTYSYNPNGQFEGCEENDHYRLRAGTGDADGLTTPSALTFPNIRIGDKVTDLNGDEGVVMGFDTDDQHSLVVKYRTESDTCTSTLDEIKAHEPVF